jgi:hypothetical protein
VGRIRYSYSYGTNGKGKKNLKTYMKEEKIKIRKCQFASPAPVSRASLWDIDRQHKLGDSPGVTVAITRK